MPLASDILFINLLTYNRYQYALRTISSALYNIKTTARIFVHVASDGDEEPYIKGLEEAVCGFDNVEAVTTSNSKRKGYGANMNVAMRAARVIDARYVLQLEDDWELSGTLNLDPLMATIDESNSIRCIRLGYLGWTQLLKGWLEHWNGSAYLVLDPDSAEPHVFAGHPRLESVNFSAQVGNWPEDMLPGETEFAVAQRETSRRNVAWPLDLIPPRGGLFRHIGEVRAY